MTWQELRPSVPYRNAADPVDGGKQLDIDEEQFMNDEYVVYRRYLNAEDPDAPAAMHLSIRRQDRAPVRDWRDFQRIKNQLAGPEWTGVEIYPAESVKVDGANQYHLWCFDVPGLGFGFNRRIVANQAQIDMVTPGAIQRDPEPVDLMYGGLSKLKTLIEDNPRDPLTKEEL